MRSLTSMKVVQAIYTFTQVLNNEAAEHIYIYNLLLSRVRLRVFSPTLVNDKAGMMLQNFCVFL